MYTETKWWNWRNVIAFEAISVWTATIGEQFSCVRVPFNVMDGCAVAVKRGHCDQALAKENIWNLLPILKERGTCTITRTRRYSEDLPQGG